MSLVGYYEIRCDFCVQADHVEGSFREATKYFKSTGWIFKRGKHYCDEKCAIKGSNDGSEK